MPEPKALLTRIIERLSPIVYLSSNWISLAGVVLVTTATVLWVFLLPTLVRADTKNLYIGIPAFLILPGIFIVGLVLIPAGMMWRRARLRRQGIEANLFPKLQLESREFRRLVEFVAFTSIVNVVIASQWGYSTINYMDSPSFCGLTCHKVMQPEYTAYTNSPHSNVDCVECHIGPGASWFVRSKLSGVGQVLAVMTNHYPRPIPSPVQNLRPARETCERCHFPQRFSGDLFQVRTSYGSDERNEVSTTVLLMKVGGKTWRGGVGIHGVHLDANSRITYTAVDNQRQNIPRVVYTAPNGTVTEYKASDAKVSAADLAKGEQRTMDCVDCHNRPTHIYQMPDRAIDQAISQGEISVKLPFIKREAVAALKREYPDRDTAAREIPANIEKFYQGNYPQVFVQNAADIKAAGATVQNIYLRNVFPEMKITWGTYPNNLGHMDFPGCFRCHDGNHVSSAGKAIPGDCNTCHDLPAMEEKSPKILTDLGYPAPSGQ